MKKTLKSIVLLGALWGGSLHATFEFRSPLAVEDRGYIHWLLAPSDQAWWSDSMPSEKKHTAWNIHAWGAWYTRSASKAFQAENGSNKVTRHTDSLSTLFFGQGIFRGENAFPGGTFAGSSTPSLVTLNNVNPFLGFARIAPRFDYDEQGVHFGIDFARYVGRDDRWHVGGRINVPFKIIEIRQDDDNTLEEGLSAVLATRNINVDEAGNSDDVEYAIRFDFLNSLIFTTTTTPSGTTVATPVVQYDNTGAPAGQVQIFGRRVTAPTAQGDSVGDAGPGGVPAAYVTVNNEGIFPAVPFRKTASQVTGVLGEDGQGADGATLFMQTNVEYAGNLQNDRDAQAQLFIVSRAVNLTNAETGVVTQSISDDSEGILTDLREIIEDDLLVSESASAFFLNNGINLSAFERIVGIGDTLFEFYFGIGHYDDWFVDGIFGVRAPTGKKQPTSNRIYYKPTGNNGHVEIQLGLDAGWKPVPWFAFEIRPYYFHACKRSEKRAAPFTGATVINIGPEIDVNISWNYFVLRTDFSFFHPHNPDLGFTLGYELFAKGKDHVSFHDDQRTATDLLGRPNQPLNAELYENRTNSLSNKLRGEIFHRWNYFELFGGASQMVAGRDIMKETEGHIGFAIYF